MSQLDATHDQALRSWVTSANDANTDFPIQNLPFGRFRFGNQVWRIGVAIGEHVLDLKLAVERQAWDREILDLLAPLAAGDLNRFMLLGARARKSVRIALSNALAEGSPSEAVLSSCLLPQDAVEFGLPCHIGDYTDFYVGIHHATAVGKLFRPDNPLLPNYKWVPIGYHGRASSIVISGTGLCRPRGQTAGTDRPNFGPTQRLDMELEVAMLIGTGNVLGEPISIDEAEDHLFGIALFNDWSARDIQAWEYQPLGPFLSKNFGSTISPWVVTMEALAPFRKPQMRPEGDPPPLPYLDSERNRSEGAIDVQLEVRLQTAQMREMGLEPVVISRSGFADAAYWTPAQLVVHHTVNGCNLQPGDLFGSGTLSGPAPGQAGSLLEITAGGKEKISLPSGETRTFLQDGDTLSLAGWCERLGARRIGFGPCFGTILPSV